ncbi:MAG: oligosaccharide flippase family protein [Acidovorax sp.]|nr:oligosaccharide flippase family protein [Acidovorax sp.]
MSLKRNIAANYASQLYTTLIGIVLVPVYLDTMGSEAYGLVGFFAMLQAWFNLLDLGLTPTIARESARFRGGAISALDYRRAYRSLSLIFISIALLGGSVLFGLAGTVADHWLKLGHLPTSEVIIALQIMAASVALRWMGGLYRGVVSGSERLVWLSGFNAVIATLRFVAVMGSMWIWGFTLKVFFWHQLAVAGLEVLVLLWMCHALLPGRREIPQAVGWSLKPIKGMLRFSLSIALTSSVWVLVTQSDKLLLSGILSLSEFGYFSSAVLVAGGITLLTSPISGSIMPRMVKLYAEQRNAEVQRIYCSATQLVAITAGSAASTMAWCAQPLMFAWTGNAEVADRTAVILSLYATGNGLLAISAFPFYLQYSRGRLRHHLIGNCAMGLLLVPTVLLAASHYGAVGAGSVWVAINALYLVTWVAYTHSQLQPGLHVKWLRDNVLVVVLPAQVLGLLSLMIADSGDRLVALVHTLSFALACLALSIASSSDARQIIRKFWEDRAVGRT